MKSLNAMQAQDRPDAAATRKAQEYLDLSQLEGTWVNTSTSTHGIAKVVIYVKANTLTVQPFGADGAIIGDWGKVEADVVYPAGIRPHECMGFVASYNFDFMESQLQGNMNLGLLIIASFNTFKDDSGRSNYFGREFFHKQYRAH